MGARGPQPKPTALDELHGRPSHKRRNKFEPQPPKVADTPPPGWLRPQAAVYWNRVVPMLANVGLLTEVDLPLLERYCDHLADYKQICDFLAAANQIHYLVYERDKLGNKKMEKGSDGRETPIVKYIGQFPQVSQKIRLSEHLLKIEMHFGMTPAARTRIMIDPSGQLPMLGNANAHSYGEDPFGADDNDRDDGSGRLPN